MAGGWGCPHEINDICTRVNDMSCDPGMKGCVLFGRFVFANEEKNEHRACCVFLPAIRKKP